ncbi:hypothetical protein D9M70_485470 [compost metagenome]
MRTAAVVALAVVLDHQFPVGRFPDGGLHGHLGVLHVVRLHVMGQGGEEVVDGWRVFRQVDEDVAAGALHVHGLEAVFLHVEVGAHFGAGEQQAAVEFVGPLVVWADQFGDFALVADAQARATVAADVVKGVDLTLAATEDDDRVVSHLQGQVIALGGDLAGHAGDQPFLVEDLLHVDLEQALVVVERLRQGEAVVAFAEHFGRGLACGFKRIAQAQGGSDVHR